MSTRRTRILGGRWCFRWLRPAVVCACLCQASLSLGVEVAEQGWTEADRHWVYNASQGSRMIPWKWFMALEQATGGGLFRELDYLCGFGYGRPQTLAENVAGLPIGFVRDVGPDGTEYAGFTCVACHTGEFVSGGRTRRVDGAPTSASFFDFAYALRQALERTLDDPARFARFAQRVLGAGHTPEQANGLRTELSEFTAGYSDLLDRSRSPHEYGYGRLDALGILVNEIVGTGINQPKNYLAPDAPVSYPHLWGAPDLDWVQWNAASDDPLARNIGEVLGVFAELEITETETKTSANFKALHQLEEKFKLLQAPKWPADWRAIDPQLAARGELLYKQECASCHAVPPAPKLAANAYGRELVAVAIVPVDDVRTSDLAAKRFLERFADTGPLAKETRDQTNAPGFAVLAAAVRRVMTAEFKRLALTPAEQLAYRDHREIGGPPAHLAKPHYKSRSLEGIWATAPFLHNGSVPTLYDLLLPPSERPTIFKVGSKELDLERVGLRSDVGLETFDTSIRGNSNQGHSYGSKLSKDDRLLLLEYLKTL
jgi:mono/diheme cytochrome c family protein